MCADRLQSKKVLALSGGVGGAKLALGLSKILPPAQLAIVANTADDFSHLGVHISPDLDTVMYTLAGLNNKELGWGLAGESWAFMNALARLGGETWFRLGDQDMATHVQRTALLSAGHSLSSVTGQLCRQLGVEHAIIPMSDDVIQTFVKTQDAELAFQHYFVREQCRPSVSGFRFEGIEKARPAVQFCQLLEDTALAGVVICPSNPFVSVEPILAIPGVRQRLAALREKNVPVIAVSPIVKGLAIKGPTAKMMKELAMPSSALSLAKYYADLIDGFVIDTQDAEMSTAIADLGIKVKAVNTLMKTLQDRIDLAAEVIGFIEDFSKR
jgi:LPPG:FO 2-phospho-L-lactate transferase